MQRPFALAPTSLFLRAKVWFLSNGYGPHILFLFLALIAWLSPLSLHRSTVRVFQKALTLEANRREPPRLAFNLMESLKKHSSQTPPKNVVNLNEVMIENADSETFLFRRLHPSAIWLNPMVISQAEFGSDPHPNLANNLKSDASKVIVRAPGAETKSVAPSGVASSATTSAAGPMHVRLQDGLYVGDGTIEMSLESAGHSDLIGYADVETGQFQFPDLADNVLNSSMVIAKVRAASGEVIGANRIPASQVAAFHQIEIHPESNHFSGTLGDLADASLMTRQLRQSHANFHAHTTNTTFASEEDLPASGHFEIPNATHGSTSLFRFEKGGYQPALYLAQSGTDPQIPMLTKSVAQALLAIAAEQRNRSLSSENKSILWGRVLTDQAPAAGIRVEADDAGESQVLYFNALMLPDPKLTATSANGFFAILHLPEGLHEVRAYQGTQFFGFANAVAESNTVTPTLVSSTKAKSLRPFVTAGAFDGSSQAAEIKLQSLGETLSTGQRQQYFIPDNDQTGFATIQPQDPAFADEVVTYNSSISAPVIPLIPNAWLDGLRTQLQGRLVPQTTVIVGFVESADYNVFLPHESDNESIQSLYFDAKGNITDAPVAGGGFALLNVPQGVQSLVIIDSTTGTAWSQVYAANNQSIFVATPRF